MKEEKYYKIKDKLKYFQTEIDQCQKKNIANYILLKNMNQYHLEDKHYFKLGKYVKIHDALLTASKTIESANEKLIKAPKRAILLCKDPENLDYLVNNVKISRLFFLAVCTEIMVQGKLSNQEFSDVEQTFFLTSKLNALSKERIQFCLDAIDKKLAKNDLEK